MSEFTTTLSSEQTAFIAKQHLFFVASAPLQGGHVNLSPKGMDTFRVVEPSLVVWLDFAGSGAETMAHTRENGRLTVMFCALAGAPKILRLQGTGAVHLPDSAFFHSHRAAFADFVGVRSLVSLAITRVASSCGYGVPRYDYVGERTQLTAWAEKKGVDGVAAYTRKKNRVSIDGLPAFDHVGDG